MDRVASLIDKSILQQTEQEGEEPRLVMLETIREYGLEALETSGEMEVTRQAHALYYLAMAEKAEPELGGLQQAVWLERLEREHENLRAAMQWSLESGEDGHHREMALRLGGALRLFWIVRGHWSEGRNFLERALGRKRKRDTSAGKGAHHCREPGHIRTMDRAESLCERVGRSARNWETDEASHSPSVCWTGSQQERQSCCGSLAERGGPGALQGGGRQGGHRLVTLQPGGVGE